MAKNPKDFLDIKRKDTLYRPVKERIKDHNHVSILPSQEQALEQSCRCMDCGTPFCHWACPLGNYIPEWNEFAAREQWEKALNLLVAKNNLPEITGRLCPALCEYACVLGINDDAITIRENELAIIEYGFQNGLIKPRIPRKRTGKKIAVIGSGPAGLSCADQLNQAGHSVIVFEKNDKEGGILRYGIPDFKLEKWIIDRRVDIMEKEGIQFKTNTYVGKNYPASDILKDFDAVCLTCGSSVPRDLKIEGREFKGIHFAMDYLIQNNKRISGEQICGEQLIEAKGKKVIVIGGGDTGADCVGTANRQQAESVIQIELFPKPPEFRSEDYPWPRYPSILRISSSHQEGGERLWSISTKKFIGEDGLIKRILCSKLEFFGKDKQGFPIMKEIKGSEFELSAEIIILAIGFVHPEQQGLISELGVKLDKRGNVKTDDNFMTSVNNVFSAGDMRLGQSLIVWAIAEGRKAASSIDKYLL